MKKTTKFILIFIYFFFLTLTGVKAEKLKINLFHSDSCPHCKSEIKYLTTLDDNIEVEYYEVSEHSELVDKVRKNLNIKNAYVPLTVIGTDYIIGFDDNTKAEIKKLIEIYKDKEYCDIVDTTINELSIDNCFEKNQDLSTDSSNKVIPILGSVDVKSVSLPLISIIIGFVDGFNPCAMWVLIFLISMLINLKDRKKMWILGLVFIISSALVYLLIMLSWLQITTNLLSTWFKYLVATFAIVGGLINLRSYLKSRKNNDGCQVTKNKDRKKIIKRIKKIVLEKNYLLSIIGMIALAFSINIVELACSAGLPVLFTEILSINALSSFEYMIYMLLYILFFMIDDIIIFIIAMFTFKVTGISNKYTKYSHLIGGLIMLIIGILLIVKPEIIMFNF